MLRQGADSGRLTHLEYLPARPGRAVAWPGWVPEQVADAFRATGVRQPWAHQAAAAEHARSGRSVIIATGTASGKSLGYLLPALSGVLAGGTAAITDAGMTGPHDSVIGVEADLAIRRMRTGMPVRFRPAEGDVRLEGVVVDCDADGRATAIEALRVAVG